MAASDDQLPAKIQVSKLSYLAKVLAALILHSYQNYADYFLTLISRCFTLGRWSRAKNMMSEMLARTILTILEQRKEVPLVDWHGKRWSTVWMKFQLNDKNVVRERWSLHRKKNSAKDEWGKEVGFLWKSYGETIVDRGVSWERRYQRPNRHRNCNSKTTRLQKTSGKKWWSFFKTS